MGTNDEYANKISAIRKLADRYGIEVKKSSRVHMLLVLEDVPKSNHEGDNEDRKSEAVIN
jgi:hypothetical protein